MADFTPAKRGDIAVMQQTRRVYTMHTGYYVQLNVSVGVVESVTRDGTVKRVKPANAASTVKTPRDWDRIDLVQRERLADPDGFLAECASRQSTDPDKWRPFEDLNDVRTTARKYAV